MDLSLLQNFQTLISTSLQSIVDDLKIQFENMKDELQEKISILEDENCNYLLEVRDLKSKLKMPILVKIILHEFQLLVT